MNFDRVLQAEPPPHRELIRGNCSDLVCPFYSQAVFPGLEGVSEVGWSDAGRSDNVVWKG